MGVKFLTTTLLILYGLHMVQSQCVCPVEHPQTTYCAADFVINAIPKSKTVNGTYEYKVKMEDILKGEKTLKKLLERGKIYTSMDPAGCGVDLTIGTKYVLSGKIINGLPTIDQCGFNSQWNKTKYHKEMIENYKKGCSCTVDTCQSGVCTKSATNCIYDVQYTNGGECYPKYGLCQPLKGVCTWSKEDKSKLLTKCLSTTSTTALI